MLCNKTGERGKKRQREEKREAGRKGVAENSLVGESREEKPLVFPGALFPGKTKPGLFCPKKRPQLMGCLGGPVG